jgi:hypothetical protein
MYLRQGPKWKEKKPARQKRRRMEGRRNGKGKEGVQTLWQERETINV